MYSPVECRRAVFDDIEAIVRLENLCFDRPWSKESITNELQSRFGRFFVAEKDGQIAAYIGSRLVMGECEIFNIATDPEFQGQGIGSQLMEFFINTISEEGAGAFSLDVRPTNGPALALYQKYGFREEGRRKKYYTNGEDALIFWRKK